MNILILTTSPKKRFSTSVYFSNILKLFLAGHNVEIVQLTNANSYNNILPKLKTVDAVVFATPVYVDTIPSTTLEYLKKLENEATLNNYSFKVYTITNCGFYEGHQCSNAIKTYELWCEKSSITFAGGIGIGAGVMIGFVRLLPLFGIAISLLELLLHSIPLLINNAFSIQSLLSGYIPYSLIIQTVLWLLFSLGAYTNLFKLRNSIVSSKFHKEKYTTVWFCPRFLFVIMASLYWYGVALFMYGCPPWKLFNKYSNIT